MDRGRETLISRKTRVSCLKKKEPDDNPCGNHKQQHYEKSLNSHCVVPDVI